jgi:multiple sugar transport system substrate-binding protein
VHLVASPIDMWYPYLWEVGGEIIKLKSGHPTKGTYWFPAYNSSEGVKAISFIKAQIDAGIKPQREHSWGKEFLDRKFAVMIEALQNHVRNDYNVTTPEKKREFEQKVRLHIRISCSKQRYSKCNCDGRMGTKCSYYFKE